MKEYEELDFIQLQDDPGVDPDNPVMLYKKACCFLLGDGCVEDKEAGMKIMKQAADLGNAEAVKEFESMRPVEVNVPAASVQTNYREKLIQELKELAEDGDLRAVIEGYTECDRWRTKDEDKEEFLKLGINAIVKGVQRQDKRLCRDILEKSGAFYYQCKQMEKSREYYEMARKLDSIEARLKLLDFYAKGIGGETDPDMEEKCAQELVDNGGPEELIKYAVWCRENDKPKDMKEIDALQKVCKETETDNPLLWARAKARLFCLAPPENRDLQDLQKILEVWAASENKAEAREELEMLGDIDGLEVREKLEALRDIDKPVVSAGSPGGFIERLKKKITMKDS